MANDNILAGVAGFASGAKDILSLIIQDKMKRNAQQEDYMQNRKLADYKANKDLINLKYKSDLDLQNQEQLIPLKEQSLMRINDAREPLYQPINSETGDTIGTPTKYRPVSIKPPHASAIAAEAPKALGSYRKAIQDYDSSINLIDRIMKDKSLGTATGATSFTGYIPGTGAKRVATDIETLKNKTLLSVLSSLKELGKNGASGFGQLSNIEGETLKNSIENLDRGLSTRDFLRNLDSFKKQLLQSKQNISDTFNKTYGRTEQNNPIQPEITNDEDDPLGLGL